MQPASFSCKPWRKRHRRPRLRLRALVLGRRPPRAPLTLLLPPPSNGRRGLGGGNSRAATARRAAGSGERGRKKGRVPHSSAGAGTRGDRLVEAVRVVGRDLDAGVTGADILELAMAKGPMFSWLTYWPEEGYPKEDHPY